MNPSLIVDALKWRYATKQFDPQKKIEAAQWEALEQSLILSPSSYGLQPWQFIVVKNPQLREQLKIVSWNQSQVTDASHLVVLAYKSKMDEAHISDFISETARARGMDPEKLRAYQNIMIGDLVKGPRAQVIEAWAQKQIYIAMGFLMETAGLLKVDTCALEGLDPEAYDELLGLKDSGFKTVAAVALGYRSLEDKYQHAAKVRFPRDRVIKTIE